MGFERRSVRSVGLLRLLCLQEEGLSVNVMGDGERGGNGQGES